MVFGLGSDKKEATKKEVKSSKKGSSQSDEAAELLKKMQDKKDAGDCPFC